MKDIRPPKYNFEEFGIINGSTRLFGTTVEGFNELIREHFQEVFLEKEIACSDREASWSIEKS